MIVVTVSWADTRKRELTFRIWNQENKRWACYYRVPIEQAIEQLKPYYLNPETQYLNVSYAFLSDLILPRLALRERNQLKRQGIKHLR
jgi:hypothetical protein